MGACASSPREVHPEHELSPRGQSCSTSRPAVSPTRAVTGGPRTAKPRSVLAGGANDAHEEDDAKAAGFVAQTHTTLKKFGITNSEPATPLRWPSWLTTHAPEALRGMTPRDAKTLTRIKQIGQGTYGAVYQCFDELTKNIVAVKKVKPARFDSSEAAAFAAREVSVLLKLKHQPHCVTLLDIAVDDCAGNEGHDDDIGINNSSNNSSESAYLVFAFSPHDLAGLVSATTKGGLRLGQVKRLAWQLFSAIASCHENGVLHRDIKGSNLLVDGNGVLKLADFGLAVDVGSARAARGDGDKDGGEKKKPEEIETTQRVPLTPRVVTLWYRPPELLLGATEYDGRVDVWSAGCVLAELISGEPVFPGRTEVDQLGKILNVCGGANLGRIPGGSPGGSKKKGRSLENSQASDAAALTSLGVVRDGDFVFKEDAGRCRVRDLFQGFPDEALDLLERIFVLDPAHRLTAKQVLTHAFFRNGPAPEPLRLTHLQNTHEFGTRRRHERVRHELGVSPPRVAINVLETNETFDPSSLRYLVKSNIEKRAMEKRDARLEAERRAVYRADCDRRSSDGSVISTSSEPGTDDSPESSDCDDQNAAKPVTGKKSGQSVLTGARGPRKEIL